MYLMISLIAVTLASAITAFVSIIIYEDIYTGDVGKTISHILFIISTSLAISALIAVLPFGIACIYENTNTDAKIEKYETRREALIYQIENETCTNDDIETYELVKDVYEFNLDVLSGKVRHEDPWYSWLYGEYYKSIELIPFNKTT